MRSDRLGTSWPAGAGGGLWWSSPDMVGTVGLQINTAGAGTVTRRWMDPFGQARGAGGVWSSLLGYLNQPASSTGVTQLGARAYDATLGRFLTVDPLLDTGEPRHANGYVYSFNSPVSYTDADGLQPIGAGDGPSKYNPGPPPYTGVAPSPSGGGGGGGTPPAAGNGGGGRSGSGGEWSGTPTPESGSSAGQNSGNSVCTPRFVTSGTCQISGISLDPDSWMRAVGWVGLAGGSVLLAFGIVCTFVMIGVCAPVAGLGSLVIGGGATLAFAGGGTAAAGAVSVSLAGVAAATAGAEVLAAGVHVLNNTPHASAGSESPGGGDDWAEVSGIVRDAAKGKGNFGLGSGTASQAERAGQAWVGDGYTIASDGKAWVSSNGLRQWRPPSYKPNLDMWQSNFESRLVPRGQWQSNGHLDITDLP